MRIVDRLRRSLVAPWLAAFFAALVSLVVLVAKLPRIAHDVSASDYATLVFNGLVSSNGAEFASFTLNNCHRHPLTFSINNIDIRTSGVWTYYATWSPGASSTHPMLGSLNNPPVWPGRDRTFLVRPPSVGQAWRLRIGVLRGIKGLTWKNRVTILLQPKSMSAAFTPNSSLTTNYHHFTFAGMLDGPVISSGVESLKPGERAAGTPDAGDGHLPSGRRVSPGTGR